MVNQNVTSGAIEIRDVGKAFGKAPNEVIALEKINLKIEPAPATVAGTISIRAVDG
jgi:hypothetical protein